ncbi:MAG: tRNA (adenosine(37)-N6)-threonylcarbamoyltransferase complex dimerization subunit type 1 TsaB [Patescibacteria group bacterium]
MILYINTTKNNQVVIAIKDGGRQIATKKFSAPYQQAEKLLPEINKLLKIKKIKLKDLKKIEVENSGGSFTSLRIGVVTANALGYALGIPIVGLSGKTKVVKNNAKLQKYEKIKCKNKINKINNEFYVVEPIYNCEPKITVKKCLNH